MYRPEVSVGELVEALQGHGYRLVAGTTSGFVGAIS